MPTPADRAWRRKVVGVAALAWIVAACLTAGASYYVTQRTVTHSTDLVRRQGQDGLIIIRKAALTECTRANGLQGDLRANGLAQRAFGRALAGFLGQAVARAKATVNSQPATQRAATVTAIAIYSHLQATVPVNPKIPKIPKACETVVPTIAELRAQASGITPS